MCAVAGRAEFERVICVTAVRLVKREGIAASQRYDGLLHAANIKHTATDGDGVICCCGGRLACRHSHVGVIAAINE